MKKRLRILMLSLAMAGVLFAEEADPLAKQNAARRDTIKYGTDTELLNLITALENEKNDTFDADLITLLNKSTGAKFIDAVFAHLSKSQKTGGEEKALKILQNRDKETNTNIDSSIQYAASVKEKKAAPFLRDILETDESKFANAAARALGACGSPEDAEYLINYTKDRSPSDAMFSDIIYALGEIKSKKATEYLVEAATNPDSNSSKKISAIQALAKVKDTSSIEAVIGALKDQDANVRSFAASALASFSGDKADKAIIESFRDSFYKVRIAAAKSAGERKLEEALPYLKYRAERDEVAAVKEQALEAMGMIGSRQAVEYLSALFADKKSADRLRISAAKALLEKNAENSASAIVAAMDQAKAEKKMPLYHGLAKAISGTKAAALENAAKRFLSSADIVDKLYGLDLAIANGYESVKELIKPLEKSDNAAIARKARQALGN